MVKAELRSQLVGLTGLKVYFDYEEDCAQVERMYHIFFSGNDELELNISAIKKVFNKVSKASFSLNRMKITIEGMTKDYKGKGIKRYTFETYNGLKLVHRTFKDVNYGEYSEDFSSEIEKPQDAIKVIVAELKEFYHEGLKNFTPENR